MSLDKAIEHGKERRKPYYGSKAFDYIPAAITAAARGVNRTESTSLETSDRL